MPSPRVAIALGAAWLPPVLVAALVWLVLRPAAAAERVGSETCGACHETAYKLWKASSHAKASENLTAAQREDLRCAYCHAPELARLAQEQNPFQPGEASTGQSRAQVEGGVGCESCHGAGQYYSPGYVMRDSELARAVGLVDPGQKSCQVCHSAEAPSLMPFDFAAKVKLIDHWSQGRPGRTAATTRADSETSASRAAADSPRAKVASP